MGYFTLPNHCWFGCVVENLVNEDKTRSRWWVKSWLGQWNWRSKAELNTLKLPIHCAKCLTVLCLSLCFRFKSHQGQLFLSSFQGWKYQSKVLTNSSLKIADFVSKLRNSILIILMEASWQNHCHTSQILNGISSILTFQVQILPRWILPFTHLRLIN